jgi:hypothetical protein
MNKNKLTFALLSIFPFALNAQQAWTKEKGKFYAQIGISSLRYSDLMNGSDEPLPLARNITDRTLHGYIEYGLTNRFTVSAQLPFKFSSATDEFQVTHFQ